MRTQKDAWKRVKKYKFIYIALLPIMLYFIVFSYAPLVMGIVQSFQQIKLSGRSDFVGLENYETVLSDNRFIQSLWNAFVIGLGKWLLIFIGGIVLAIGINELRHRWQKTFVQTSTYIPYLLSWTIALWAGFGFLSSAPMDLSMGF